MADEPKKKRTNSKRKGNGFEGHVGKVLAEVFAPMQFRRSQSSGAILGGTNAKFLEQFSDDAKALFIGDVVPTNEADIIRDEKWKFRFTLECKFYKDCDNLEHLFNNTKIRGWMEQALNDAEKLKKDPLLIFKFNRTDTFCATRKDFDVTANKIVPKSVNRWITVSFDEASHPDGTIKPAFEMVIFLFKDALLDKDWWKIQL